MNASHRRRKRRLNALWVSTVGHKCRRCLRTYRMMPRSLSLAEHAMEAQAALRDTRRSLASMYESAIRSGNGAAIAEAKAVAESIRVAERQAKGLLESLDDESELARRRAVNREAMQALDALLRAHGHAPVGPARGNFLFVEVGEEAAAFADALLRRGVIVRPMGPFGAPDAVRITAGTPEEMADRLIRAIAPHLGALTTPASRAA